MSEIQFNQFPVNFFVPGVYVEYDNSRNQAGTPVLPQKILLVGQKLAAGVATAGTAVLAPTPDEAGRLAGRGSMLHHMARAALGAASNIPVWLMPLSDAGGATASTRLLTVTGPATAAGTVALYVGGRRYTANVASAATADDVAAAIVAAIMADDLRFVDAAADEEDEHVITLTARNAGVEASKISCVLNRYSDEFLPAGVGITIAALTAGTGNPDITTPITTAIQGQWYPTFVVPYVDSGNLAVLKTELESRNGPLRQIEGINFLAVDDSVQNEITLAESLNSAFVAPVDGADFLTPTFVVAAQSAAVQAALAQLDPALPEQTQEMPGILAKPDAQRRTDAERQLLLAGGVGTLYVDTSGTVRAQRLVTSYRKNAYSVTDNSRFDVTHTRIWAQTRFSIRARFTGKFGQFKLGVDGSLGARTMTPSLAKSECVSLYKQFMDLGWFEGGVAFETFKTDLKAEIDATDKNRLNILFPPDFMNQLRVTAVLVQPVG